MASLQFVRFARALALLPPITVAAAAVIVSGCNQVAQADPPPLTNRCPPSPMQGQPCAVQPGVRCSVPRRGSPQSCVCETPEGQPESRWVCRDVPGGGRGPLPPPDLAHA